MGPVKQIQRMFEQHRIIATVVMLISVVLTLVFAFKVKRGGAGNRGALCMVPGVGSGSTTQLTAQRTAPAMQHTLGGRQVRGVCWLAGTGLGWALATSALVDVLSETHITMLWSCVAYYSDVLTASCEQPGVCDCCWLLLRSPCCMRLPRAAGKPWGVPGHDFRPVCRPVLVSGCTRVATPPRHLQHVSNQQHVCDGRRGHAMLCMWQC